MDNLFPPYLVLGSKRFNSWQCVLFFILLVPKNCPLIRQQEGLNTLAQIPPTTPHLSAPKPDGKSFWYGEDRPCWLGPIPYDYPTYPNGEFPGDYGFDIAGLSKDHVAFQKYFKLHAHWAMLRSLGVVIPELLDQFDMVSFVEPVWWRVGYAKLKGDTLDYLGIPGLHIAGGQGVLVIAICQALLMVGPEYARYCGIEALEPLGIYLPGDINHPRELLFDPLGLSKDPVAFEQLKVKEIKNG